ncbi:MAG: GNAT family N-acetyltransferase [Planctomycetota bacterium]|nr:GNAT family N-acetyltransferase [Planctomycetota bacterium]
MAKPDESAPTYDVHAVTVDVVRPLRLRYLRPGQPEESVAYKSDEFDSAVHFVVRDEDGQAIGVGSGHVENRVAGHPPHLTPGFRVRGMAVETEWRGKGVGRAILGSLIDAAREAGATEVWANARTESIGIYEKSGFARLSSEFDIPLIGEHVVAVLGLLTRKELKAMRAAEAAEAKAAAEQATAEADEVPEPDPE